MRTAMLFVIALGVAACGGDTGETATEDSTTTTAVVTTTSTEAASTTTTTEATTTTTETTTTSAPQADECLIGAWELDSEAFMEGMGEMLSEEEGGEDVSVEYVGGSYIVTMAGGGRFTGDRDEWSFEFSTPEGAFRITIDGIDTGLWEIDGDTLIVSDVDSASTVTAQAVVDGELVDLPGGVVPQVESDAVGNRSSFECSGTSLVVTPEEGFATSFRRVDG